MRRVLLIVDLLATAFGLGCLNYTADGKATHHREFAREHGLPEPSNAIFLLGIASTVTGSVLFGYALGRRRAGR